MVLAFFICIVIVIVVFYIMIVTVKKDGSSKIISKDNVPKDVDAIIVLGAGIKSDGSPSVVLRDRLKTAIIVYNEVQNVKLLLSGDHRSDKHNEVKSMKKYVMENSDIAEEDIFLDHAGFSSYETMYRAERIFKVKKAIVITNKYHLPRALYIGKKMGIDVYGVPSDMSKYLRIKYYKIREACAQLKDFFYVNIFKPKPTYLGVEIPIKISNGKVTDDELKV